jgi:hypothetical protein
LSSLFAQIEVEEVEAPPPPPEPTYSYVGVLGHFEKDLANLFENRWKLSNLPNPFPHVTKILTSEETLPVPVDPFLTHQNLNPNASDSAAPATSVSNPNTLASIRNAFFHQPINLIGHAITPETYEASINRYSLIPLSFSLSLIMMFI